MGSMNMGSMDMGSMDMGSMNMGSDANSDMPYGVCVSPRN
jgi:hypothetical protein